METTFRIKGKLTINAKTVFDLKSEQDVYNELRNKGFFDLSVSMERDEK